MKKKGLVLAVLSLTAITSLASCGGEISSTNSNSNSSYSSTSSSEVSISEESSKEVSSSENSSSASSSSESSTSSSDSVDELAKYKQAALEKLDELVLPVIEKITDSELKTKVQEYYDAQKTYVNSINDVPTAKLALNKIVDDTESFALETLKPFVINKLNSTINPLIAQITDEGLKTSVQSFYDTQMAKFNNADSLDKVVELFSSVLTDTKAFIVSETEKLIIELKNQAIAQLDTYLSALIEKIPYDELKESTKIFYAEEKKKLEDVTTIEGFEPCIAEIKSDLEAFALTESKKIALNKLDEVVNSGLEKLPDSELKDDLNEFYKNEKAKINAISKLEDVPTTLQTVLTETEEYIKELLVDTAKSVVKNYVAKLMNVNNTTAYDYLPKAMQPNYQANVVDASSIAYDFSSFTNVSDFNKAGFGEQWQMVVENINQSVSMSKVFNIAQTIIAAAGTAVDAYVDNFYNEDMSYNFSGEGYTAEFKFKNSILTFNIFITQEQNVPGIGSVKPVIRMEYDANKEAQGFFISLGDAYKIKYVITKNGYEMATNYGLTIGGKNVSRSSYLSVAKNDGKTTGHIYEYTTYEGSDKIKACADFYVENGYVSVVGNKSSGMIAFDGYINELYSENEGRMLGYEVREELTIAGVTGTYNTLWFNLWDIKGINSVKVLDKTDDNTSSRSTVDVYVNGSSKLLSPTYNTKIIKTSRKYDIEFRNRYYYTYDAENESYVANCVSVPMMFIQEGSNYNSFTSDIKKDNNIDASVSLNQTHLNKILADYDTLIDIFIVNKESMSSETINEYLEQYE